MEKKAAPYYIASGILFLIAFILSKKFILLILPISLIVIGVTMKIKNRSN
ncbi:hypothetical protein [Clostridium sp.]